MKTYRVVSIAVAALALFVGPGSSLAEERLWAVTAYGAVLSSDPIEEVVALEADFDSDYQLAVLALSRRFQEPFQKLDLEGELQLSKHTKGQNHWELNGLLAVRWLPFPWDGRVDTSLAFGAGLSLASMVPPLERENREESSDLLGYLLVELELRPPASERLSLVARLHHRSGAFGTFDGVHGASNALGLGLKFRF